MTRALKTNKWKTCVIFLYCCRDIYLKWRFPASGNKGVNSIFPMGALQNGHEEMGSLNGESKFLIGINFVNREGPITYLNAYSLLTRTFCDRSPRVSGMFFERSRHGCIRPWFGWPRWNDWIKSGCHAPLRSKNTGLMEFFDDESGGNLINWFYFLKIFWHFRPGMMVLFDNFRAKNTVVIDTI